jgi:magnesium-transporting ATPase (P-type)
MKRDGALIRVYEVLVTIGSSYLAISSFFASSLYDSLSQLINRVLAAYDILTISSTDVTKIVPLLVSAIVFLVVIYDYAIGKPENMIDIFEINLVLISPEVLSFSKLNWMNLIEKPQILEPTRGPATVFLTGVVILVGYISLLFTSKFKETSRELVERGADYGRVQEIFVKQSVLTIGLVFASALLSLVVYVSIPFVSSLMASSISRISYSYLVLGILAVVIFSVTVFFFYNEQRSMGSSGKGPFKTGLDDSASTP